MKKLFVNYKVCKLAKDNGFDEPCIAIYGGSQNLSILSFPVVESENVNKTLYTKAPTHQQLIDWLEQKHNIHVSRIWYNDKVTPTRWVYHIDGDYVGLDFNEALIQAIKRIK